jgi:hypothetical protein
MRGTISSRRGTRPRIPRLADTESRADHDLPEADSYCCVRRNSLRKWSRSPAGVLGRDAEARCPLLVCAARFHPSRGAGPGLSHVRDRGDRALLRGLPRAQRDVRLAAHPKAAPRTSDGARAPRATQVRPRWQPALERGARGAAHPSCIRGFGSETQYQGRGRDGASPSKAVARPARKGGRGRPCGKSAPAWRRC